MLYKWCVKYGLFVQNIARTGDTKLNTRKLKCLCDAFSLMNDILITSRKFYDFCIFIKKK